MERERERERKKNKRKPNQMENCTFFCSVFFLFVYYEYNENCTFELEFVVFFLFVFGKIIMKWFNLKLI